MLLDSALLNITAQVSKYKNTVTLRRIIGLQIVLISYVLFETSV